LIQMPSEKISALCVMHLMKHLLTQFVNNMREFEDESSLGVTEKKEMEFAERDLKIPAITLFLELGQLFDKEMKHSLSS